MLYGTMINAVVGTQTLNLATGAAPIGIDVPANHVGYSLVRCLGANVRLTFEGVDSGAGLLLRPDDVLVFGSDGMNQATFAADGAAASVYVVHHN